MVEIKIMTDANYQSLIGSSKKLAIDVWAEWCGPCKQSTPIFVDFGKKMGGPDFIFAKLDAQNNRLAAKALGILNLPTFILFKDGKLHKKWAGADIARLQKELIDFNKI